MLSQEGLIDEENLINQRKIKLVFIVAKEILLHLVLITLFFKENPKEIK